ncbi:MAG TPA: SCO family protein [Verrucomicrobiae bacterium]|nr:SCO family protein [Verrucomicrobiae bacterium]
MKCFIGLLMVGLMLGVTSCGEKPPSSPAPVTSPTATAVSTQIFQVKGVVVGVKPEEKTVRIRHEDIPGYMEAMTMPFEVKDTNELAGVKDGDTVSFRMLVTETDGWIDQIKKLDVPTVNTLPANSGIRIVRDVEPLEVGHVLPEYTFTNQLGQAVSLSQFRGKALAFTFIFTRCPFPAFCPLMSNNFRAVREALQNNPNAPTNWHLLTISFDPDFDTPEVLKRYAASYKADPAQWSFVTGTLVDITALSEQVGLQFWREPGGNINHNLRTVVVDAQGRIQKIYPENKWTVEELTEEIIKAAGAK